MPVKYEKIVNGPFQENCYLVYDSKNMKGIFIDPGYEAARLMDAADKLGVEVQAIYNTHGHIDHVGAVNTIVNKLKIPFALNMQDEPILNSLSSQAAMFGIGLDIEKPLVSIEIVDNDKFKIGNIEATAIYTPGHSPGGVCFLIGNFCFSGDTLFSGSIGRSDLMGGDGRLLISSIERRLMVLPDETIVLPGHGPSTTIGHERKYNPFL
jgi:hydroxyacylglutathione hydrolase